MHVLTHEAMHMSGITVEADWPSARPCSATRGWLVLLGASQREGAALAETYWRTVYPADAGPVHDGGLRRGRSRSTSTCPTPRGDPRPPSRREGAA